MHSALTTWPLSRSGRWPSSRSTGPNCICQCREPASDFETNATLDVTVAVDDAAARATTPTIRPRWPSAVTDVERTTDSQHWPTPRQHCPKTRIPPHGSRWPTSSSPTMHSGHERPEPGSGADCRISLRSTGANCILSAGAGLGLRDQRHTGRHGGGGRCGRSHPDPNDTAALAISSHRRRTNHRQSHWSNTTTTLPEDTDTSARIKVADIVITDDALGANDLSPGSGVRCRILRDRWDRTVPLGRVPRLDFETNRHTWT